MKKLVILFLFFTTVCSAQKFEFVFGIGPTYSFTKGNIKYSILPEFSPSVSVEDPRTPEKYGTKSIDWIQNKDYFGLEPYCEAGYNLGKTFRIGLGFYGRHRQLRYDVFLPLIPDAPVFSHSYKLDFNFIATTLNLNFKNEKQDINIGINLGFNYPLNKLDEYYIFEQTINQFDIRESVVAQVKGGHNGASFTLNPLIRLNVAKYLNDKFCIGVSVEKQIENEYGSEIRINDTSTSETILKGSVLGSDLTFGLMVGYRLSL